MPFECIFYIKFKGLHSGLVQMHNTKWRESSLHNRWSLRGKYSAITSEAWKFCGSFLEHLYQMVTKICFKTKNDYMICMVAMFVLSQVCMHVRILTYAFMQFLVFTTKKETVICSPSSAFTLDVSLRRHWIWLHFHSIKFSTFITQYLLHCRALWKRLLSA